MVNISTKKMGPTIPASAKSCAERFPFPLDRSCLISPCVIRSPPLSCKVALFYMEMRKKKRWVRPESNSEEPCRSQQTRGVLHVREKRDYAPRICSTCRRCFSSSFSGWLTHNHEAHFADMRRLTRGISYGESLFVYPTPHAFPFPVKEPFRPEKIWLRVQDGNQTLK